MKARSGRASSPTDRSIEKSSFTIVEIAVAIALELNQRFSIRNWEKRLEEIKRAKENAESSFCEVYGILEQRLIDGFLEEAFEFEFVTVMGTERFRNYGGQHSIESVRFSLPTYAKVLKYFSDEEIGLPPEEVDDLCCFDELEAFSSSGKSETMEASPEMTINGELTVSMITELLESKNSRHSKELAMAVYLWTSFCQRPKRSGQTVKEALNERIDEMGWKVGVNARERLLVICGWKDRD